MGSSGRMEPDSIYVSNLKPSTTQQSLFEALSAYGARDDGEPRIWFYNDEVTKQPNGTAAVTFETSEIAKKVKENLDGKELLGSVVRIAFVPVEYQQSVSATSTAGSAQSQQGQGYQRQSYGDRTEGGRRDFRSERKHDSPDDHMTGGGHQYPQEMRPGDWICASCKNHNFARRDNCHRCHALKTAGSEAAAGSGPATGGTPGGGWHQGRDAPRDAPRDGGRRDDYGRGPAGYPRGGRYEGGGRGYGGDRDPYPPRERDRDYDRDRRPDAGPRFGGGYGGPSAGYPRRDEGRFDDRRQWEQRRSPGPYGGPPVRR